MPSTSKAKTSTPRGGLFTTVGASKAAQPYVDVNKFAFLTGVDADELPRKAKLPSYPSGSQSARSQVGSVTLPSRKTRDLGQVLFGDVEQEVKQTMRRRSRVLMSMGGTLKTESAIVDTINRTIPPLGMENSSSTMEASRSVARHQLRDNSVWVPGESAALAVCDGKTEFNEDPRKSPRLPIGWEVEPSTEDASMMARKRRSVFNNGEKKSMAEFYGTTDIEVAIADEPNDLLEASSNDKVQTMALSVRGRQRIKSAVKEMEASQLDMRNTSSASKEPGSGSRSPHAAFLQSQPSSVYNKSILNKKQHDGKPHLGSTRPGGQASISPTRTTESTLESINDAQAATMYQELSRRAGNTARDFGLAKEMKELTAPRELLPRSSHYQHLHSMDAICEVKGVHNIANGMKPGDAEDGIIEDEETADAAPKELQWHYLLRKDALQAARREEAIHQQRQEENSLKTTAGANGKGKASMKRSLKPGRAKGSQMTSRKGRSPSPSGRNSPTMASGTSKGIWSTEELSFMAEELINEELSLTKIQTKRSGADDPYEQAAIERRIQTIENSSVKEVGAEAMAEFLLYKKNNALFSLNGEDTDMAQYPNFPFGVDESSAQHAHATIDDKTQQKFERGLLTRQLQRNRKLVDDRDNPQFDWNAWKAAAGAAFNASQQASDVSLMDVADKMQFQWRTVCDKREVQDLPCHGANNLAREALLKNRSKKAPGEAGGPVRPRLPQAPNRNFQRQQHQ